jgi:hypothetical protein
MRPLTETIDIRSDRNHFSDADRTAYYASYGLSADTRGRTSRWQSLTRRLSHAQPVRHTGDDQFNRLRTHLCYRIMGQSTDPGERHFHSQSSSEKRHSNNCSWREWKDLLNEDGRSRSNNSRLATPAKSERDTRRQRYSQWHNSFDTERHYWRQQNILIDKRIRLLFVTL